MSEEKIVQLAVNQIQPNPLQPRGAIKTNELEDLAKSITLHGVLEPLVVAKTPAGLQIIAGERRWRAARLAGLTTVPAVIKETTPQGMLELALVENVQREDLNPLERAKAFERLLYEFNLSVGEVAERVGKSSPYVSNSMRLLKLPDALKDGLLDNLITEGHARALASIDDKKAMLEAYKIVLKEDASVRRAEELARRFKKHTGQKPRLSEMKQALIVSEKLDYMQNQMQAALGHKAKVSLKQSLRQARLQIVLKGDPEETNLRLEKIFEALAQK